MLPGDIKDRVIASDDELIEFLLHLNVLKKNDELLLLVNKQNHLQPSYVPNDLVDITEIFPTRKDQTFLRKIILDDLREMFDGAKKDRIELVIISAYRSYDVQIVTFEKWVKILGYKEASRISAVPGASQHQLGTTIDFNDLSYTFDTTPEGKWLSENAFNYGFIMSYPRDMEEITGYRFEPWHYRCIGKEAAYIVSCYFNNNLEQFLQFYWSIQDYLE